MNTALIRIHAAVMAALALAGCAKIDQKAIEARVAEQWRHCQIVVPEKITIEANDGKVVRYSYVLRMRADGLNAHPGGFNCFKPDIAMIEALANKDMVTLKQGMEIPVVQEIRAR